MFQVADNKQVIRNRKPPNTQFDFCEFCCFTNSEEEEEDLIKTGPLYRVINEAPDTAKMVPTHLAFPLLFFKSSFSILNPNKKF